MGKKMIVFSTNRNDIPACKMAFTIAAVRTSPVGILR